MCIFDYQNRRYTDNFKFFYIKSIDKTINQLDNNYKIFSSVVEYESKNVFLIMLINKLLIL